MISYFTYNKERDLIESHDLRLHDYNIKYILNVPLLFIRIKLVVCVDATLRVLSPEGFKKK